MGGGRPRASHSGVHVILGMDSYLAEEALGELLTAAVGRDRTDSVEVLHGEETSWGRVIEAARTGSLFAPQRAVVVRNAEALKGEGDEVSAYLGDPSPGVALVLLAGKPDRRRGVWRRILERATVVPAEPLKGRALRPYVAERLRRRRLALTDEGFEELLERVGQDLRRLMGEADKLQAFAQGKPEPLSAEDVAAVLGRGLARPLYRLADAMSRRRAAEALALTEEILEDGEAPLRILGTLHRALRQVRGVRALKDARASREDIVSRLGVLPFKVGDLLEAAHSWSDEELRAGLLALERADRRLKQGSDARVALASAVTEACRGAAGVRPAGRPGR